MADVGCILFRFEFSFGLTVFVLYYRRKERGWREEEIRLCWQRWCREDHAREEGESSRGGSARWNGGSRRLRSSSDTYAWFTAMHPCSLGLNSPLTITYPFIPNVTLMPKQLNNILYINLVTTNELSSFVTTLSLGLYNTLCIKHTCEVPVKCKLMLILSVAAEKCIAVNWSLGLGVVCCFCVLVSYLNRLVAKGYWIDELILCRGIRYFVSPVTYCQSNSLLVKINSGSVLWTTRFIKQLPKNKDFR